MKMRHVQLGAFLFAMALAFGCASTPAAVEGDIAIPATFEKVWYRSTLDRPGLEVMSDTGTVTVSNDALTFAGEKDNVSIPYGQMHSISFKKLGTDYINNWVVIAYGNTQPTSYAVMSAGKELGWGAGSDKIFSTIEYVIKKNNVTSVEITK